MLKTVIFQFKDANIVVGEADDDDADVEDDGHSPKNLVDFYPGFSNLFASKLIQSNLAITNSVITSSVITKSS